MEILYIQSPRLSPRFDTARAKLIGRLKAGSGVRVADMSLSSFADWYVEEAKTPIVPEFDLTIVECSLDSLAKEIKYYMGKDGPFLRHADIWPSIVQESAMGAVLHASLCHRVVIFLYEHGKVTKPIKQAISLYGHVGIKKHTELSEDFIRSLALRTDFGRSALPTATTWVPAPLGEPLINIPAFESGLLSEHFISVDPLKDQLIHWWILAVCADQFKGRLKAVVTLCLAVEYAKRILGAHLEGTPLQFQAAIVPNGWWKDNSDGGQVVLNLPDLDFKLSMKRERELTQLLHLSNGISTIFLFLEDGTLTGLIDVGSEERKIHRRLDDLRDRIGGFIMSTDDKRQIWIHSHYKVYPLTFANGKWTLESTSSDPLMALVLRLGGKWRESQIERICRVLERLSDEQNGSFLIFCSDPMRAAEELKAKPLRAAFGQHAPLPAEVEALSEATLAHILGLDGAHFFDFGGHLCLACQLLAPAAQQEKTAGGGGTKHAMARRVACLFPDAIVVAVSQDGPITTLAEGWRYRTKQNPAPERGT
jgi:hypothetical protein